MWVPFPFLFCHLVVLFRWERRSLLHNTRDFRPTKKHVCVILPPSPSTSRFALGWRHAVDRVNVALPKSMLVLLRYCFRRRRIKHSVDVRLQCGVDCVQNYLFLIHCLQFRVIRVYIWLFTCAFSVKYTLPKMVLLTLIASTSPSGWRTLRILDIFRVNDVYSYILRSVCINPRILMCFVPLERAAGLHN